RSNVSAQRFPSLLLAFASRENRPARTAWLPYCAPPSVHCRYRLWASPSFLSSDRLHRNCGQLTIARICRRERIANFRFYGLEIAHRFVLLQCRRDEKLPRRRIIFHVQNIRFAADLAVFNVILPPAPRLIHGGNIPFAAAGTLKPCFHAEIPSDN